MGHHHQQAPVLHLRVPLQKTVGLSRQAVVKARIGVHLPLQQHHREFGAAGFGAAGGWAGPEHAVEAVAQLLAASQQVV